MPQSPSNDILFAGNSPGGRSDDAISDDGDLNYKKGDVVKGSAQLYGSVKLSYENYGVFVSGMGWEDYVEDNSNVPHGNSPTTMIRTRRSAITVSTAALNSAAQPSSRSMRSASSTSRAMP